MPICQNSCQFVKLFFTIRFKPLVCINLKKNLKKIMITTPNVNSHLNTTNIYVQKNIILENIKKLDKILNQSLSKEFDYYIHYQVVKLKKKQKTILNIINSKIRIKESEIFSFGGYSSD